MLKFRGMRKTEYIIVVLSVFVALTLSFSFAQPSAAESFTAEHAKNAEKNKSSNKNSADSASSAVKQVKAARIVCEGLIDDGLFKSIQRRTDEALADGCTYLFYDINTYGGLVASADAICEYLIFEVSDKADTVAFVTKKAISAGAMISVSCEDIIMLENTTIGDCAPLTMGSKLEGVEREKAESYIRSTFDRAAETNKYPKALLRAMVSQQLEIWQVKNLQSGANEYFEKEQLPTDSNSWDIANKELIVRDDEILTLTAKRAKELGIARAVVSDVDQALGFLQERDGVTFAGQPKVYHTNWSEELVRLINSPAVMGVLVLLAFLGVYLELNTPGVGLPGLVAVVCFVIIIGSKYLIGLANWIEVAIFFVGIVLLLVEFFVLPGFGIAGVAGIICLLAGLFGMLVKNRPDEVPWPQSEMDWNVFMDGALGLIIGTLLFIIAACVIARYLPKFTAFAGLSLIPAIAKKGDEYEVSMTAPQDAAGQGVRIGDVGEVVTKLRPAGRAKFGERIVDVLCEGEFIDTGVKVEIIRIKGNRVVVRTIPDS
ncbi:MAG: hypothetical protein JW804_03080 [Sedimentisphaerales bacterium]|nr:hypothetical protein [Sedimentisphaerales bacterium]